MSPSSPVDYRLESLIENMRAYNIAMMSSEVFEPMEEPEIKLDEPEAGEPSTSAVAEPLFHEALIERMSAHEGIQIQQSLRLEQTEEERRSEIQRLQAERLTDCDRHYEGEWLNSMPHGRGKETYPDGSTYTGKWRHGNYYGKGIMTYKNGSSYSGNWEFGRRSGKGKEIDAHGNTYEGEWEGDLRHGQGKQIVKFEDKEESYEGRWQNNKFHRSGLFVDVEGNTYKGQFSGNWKQFRGSGKITYQNGQSYQGEFSAKDDSNVKQGPTKIVRTGQGILTHGKVKQNGLWENDVLISSALEFDLVEETKWQKKQHITTDHIDLSQYCDIPKTGVPYPVHQSALTVAAMHTMVYGFQQTLERLNHRLAPPPSSSSIDEAPKEKETIPELMGALLSKVTSIEAGVLSPKESNIHEVAEKLLQQAIDLKENIIESISSEPEQMVETFLKATGEEIPIARAIALVRLIRNGSIQFDDKLKKTLSLTALIFWDFTVLQVLSQSRKILRENYDEMKSIIDTVLSRLPKSEIETELALKSCREVIKFTSLSNSTRQKCSENLAKQILSFPLLSTDRDGDLMLGKSFYGTDSKGNFHSFSLRWKNRISTSEEFDQIAENIHKTLIFAKQKNKPLSAKEKNEPNTFLSLIKLISRTLSYLKNNPDSNSQIADSSINLGEYILKGHPMGLLNLAQFYLTDYGSTAWKVRYLSFIMIKKLCEENAVDKHICAQTISNALIEKETNPYAFRAAWEASKVIPEEISIHSSSLADTSLNVFLSIRFKTLKESSQPSSSNYQRTSFSKGHLSLQGAAIQSRAASSLSRWPPEIIFRKMQ